ncbi:glycosyltransferase involved in cell wall biosynthesis [Azospirillum agricola]|uniref:glycosyltransferase family 2 protein n=1 Tax=Azospirillum agricola TaxID=1720247 RepID=UPI001AE5C88A|nr:glycosyltransferase family 2 protein [Azospirillum agricola]MBP2232815.1 glycosyltransferase involved in cell wall biosynthesis [Azospirillum agricola]
MSLSDAPTPAAPAARGDAAQRVNRPHRTRLSVVIPFFNEGANIAALFDRLTPALDGLNVDWEVVCVNDGSRDDTLDRLLDAHDRDSRIKVVDLSRNFGKELALSAGLARTTGDAVVPMDADLQHPPELLPAFLEKWREGYDVVVAVRHARVGQSLKHRLFARMFYWIFDHLSEIKLPREVGDFRLMDRKVVEVINRMPERTRFMKGIFAWVGFRQAAIPYEQGERAGGDTKWGFLKLLRLSLDGLTAFSTFPLRVWSLVGMALSGVAFVYILIRLVRTLFHGIDVPGYESLLVAVLFLGGIQLITLGIIGDYLGRVFAEVKGRPLFIVRSAHGFEDEDDRDDHPGGFNRDFGGNRRR